MGKIKLHTELCDMLGIKYPVLQAGMGGIAGPRLAAAVSNAGGLGVLGATAVQPEVLRSWIKETRDLTDKPFGVDILMPAGTLVGGTDEELRTQIPHPQVDFVKQLKKEYEVPDVKGKILPWTMDYSREQFEVILEEKAPVFCSGLGTPDWVLPKAHAQGMKVVSLVGNVRNAVTMNEQGSDIIVAQGHEAGGHTGRIGTMALVPQVVDAVAPTPVVCAGGIGDGRGLAAALVLGAVGVWVGTAFLLAEESMVEAAEGIPGMATLTEVPGAQVDRYKQRMLNSSEEGTIVTRYATGKTNRLLRHELIDRCEKSDVPSLGMPLQSVLITDLLAGLNEIDHPCTPLVQACGQITGMLKEVKPAKQIVEEMVEQASSIIE